MKGYNRRLDHRTDVVAIDYIKKTVKLILPGSKPKFIYEEQLCNVELQEYTEVSLGADKIYVGDMIVDTTGTQYKVEKVPGGYYPFVIPVNKNFKKVEDE